MMRWRAMLPVAALLAAGVCVAQEVTVTAAEDGWRVQAATYAAAVGGDGCLTSLQVVAGGEGVEFLTSGEQFPRGAYAYQGGILRLTDIQQPEPGVIVASGEKATLRWEFAPEQVTVTLTNPTAERLSLVVVLDAGVSAVGDEFGWYERAPTSGSGRQCQWFRDGAKLSLLAPARWWGPWQENHQVWQLTLEPKAEQQVVLRPGAPTEDEVAEVERAVNAVITPPQEPEGPMWDLETLSQPPQTYPAGVYEQEGVRAIFYEGRPFRGRPTRVFAYLGLPEVEPGQKVPGMVLVHGGGGTAYAEWVRLWTARGYAAISMDTCGCLPGDGGREHPRHEHGGPPGWGGFDQMKWPREDQWTYHAVADALLANSLVRSLPEVDPERIGVTGISWGGYLTSVIAGVDPRLKLAIPVYGCGYYLDTTFAPRVKAVGEEGADRWMRWWDPSAYLHNAAMPMLWVTGTNDFAYWFPALQKSYRDPTGPRTLCVRLRMAHGHNAGWSPEEIYAFADSVLKNGIPLARITGQGRDGATAWVTYESDSPIVRAELLYTKDSNEQWPEREWQVAEAQLDGNRASATLPEGTTCWFMNVIDERDLVVSSEHEEL
ncbi:MAG TPA: acetylxylan esterase [Armatimonadota bacterium]|nr:acetylxylan esterase [Armatimonadota bacterium]